METVVLKECWSLATERTAGPIILDGKFFKYIEDKSNSYCTVGMCQICLPKVVEIRQARNCTSNFVRHLRRVHGENVVDEYRCHLRYRRSRKKLLKAISIKNRKKLRHARNEANMHNFNV